MAPSMAHEHSILLVEDNSDDEALTLMAFKRYKIQGEITVARDGAEALDYLFARGPFAKRETGLPDVMILDLKLPKIDGLDVLRTLRQDPRTRLLPVVIFTSSKEERDVIEGYSLGCNSYVQKPIDFQQFNHAIQQLGLYWTGVNEPPPPPPVS